MDIFGHNAAVQSANGETIKTTSKHLVPLFMNEKQTQYHIFCQQDKIVIFMGQDNDR